MKQAILLILFTGIIQSQIFVAVDGNDTNPGTIALPLKSIPAAVSRARAGDTIFVRGGIYTLSDANKISISKNGTASNRYHLTGYAGERPLLDFSSMSISSSNRGLSLTGSYWYVKGIDIKGAGDNGMYISGSNNIVEHCSFYENYDTGLQLAGGAANNKIINCDSYYNADVNQGNADGFAPKLNVGSNNYFYGCRAWQNSDDGWDGYLRPSDNISTVIENCWAFKNGYLKNGAQSSGNGNGFKMGGSDLRDLRHNVVLKNCLAFDNRVKGFDQNNNRGSMTLYNCTGYNNGTNYSIFTDIDSNKSAILTNNASMGNYGVLASWTIQQKNSWMSPFVVTAEDFLSLDTLGVRGPRNADGSLPVLNFLRLAQGSDLIDAGIDVGLPFNGIAPDLGAFETSAVSDVTENETDAAGDFILAQNYPNPFNPATRFSFHLPKSGQVNLDVFDILGNKVSTVYSGTLQAGKHEMDWTAEDEYGNIFSGGIYIARLRYDSGIKTVKLILLK